MLRSYLKIAWRNLLKQKVFAVVNIGGMTVAFCAALLLALTAYREWSYDNFHVHADKVFQLYREEQTTTGSRTANSGSEPMADVIKKDIAGVDRVARMDEGNYILRYQQHTFTMQTHFVDPEFLQMFTFPLVKGNIRTALQQRSQLVLTEKVARSVFANEEPVGKNVELNIDGKWLPFTVSGVLADIPDNSGFHLQVLTRFENASGYEDYKGQWTRNNFTYFVQLSDKATAASFEQQMKTVANRYNAELIKSLKESGIKPAANGEYLQYKTIPLSAFHFHPESAVFSGLSSFYPWLMLILATVVIAIACINFVNLSIARSFIRANEIGLRKALGAMDKQLMLQFWCEAFLICLAAMVLSVFLSCLFMPYYNTISGRDISLRIFGNGWIIPAVAVVFLLVTLLAGGYPAWLVTRFNIVQVLKGKLAMGRNGNLRNGLIIVQFVVAILLISCTAIIWQQLKFVRSAPLGFNTTQVVSIPLGNTNTASLLAALRNRLAQEPEVESVTGSMSNLGIGSDHIVGTWHVGFTFKGRQITSVAQQVDYDYTKTLGLKLSQGRDFSREYGTDTAAVLINEALAKQLGEKDPLSIRADFGEDRMVQVIGVLKDFHYKSLRRSIEPLLIMLSPKPQLSYAFIRVNTQNPPATLAKLQGIWKALNPVSTDVPTFLDENVNRQYRNEQQFSKIFITGAVLAMVISSMGLFAIAVMAMTQRRREIGIRKVLGASVSGIVLLLSRDFLKLVLAAILIATPVAWFFMHRWLQDFAFHVSIHWWVFALAGGIAVLIAFVTVSTQSIRAALINPVKSLNEA
ncbi:ABC transporter permease [Chitinophaga vietnamensis]|uniref:ABC transporter permease n=1 Tax=Chitinophaga vietnamensis TaxID=2593957 RepID=UPI001178122B|nr:ABC transporter permease [Chitinophaga vietnamensis]